MEILELIRKNRNGTQNSLHMPSNQIPGCYGQCRNCTFPCGIKNTEVYKRYDHDTKQYFG